MKSRLQFCLCLTLVACQVDGTAGNLFDSIDDSVGEALGAPPADPVLAAPVMPTTGINGNRPSRTTLEPQTWLTCIPKTTMTCSTSSAGIGSACGATAPCNSDLFCIGGICAAPVGPGGACSSNNQCGTYAGAQMACINGACQPKSAASGACDEDRDCSSSSLYCINKVCRTQGDLGAPCQLAIHCKPTSSSGQPLVCLIPTGSTVGTCQIVSGPGSTCVNETQCNQATAPRCIPTSPNRTCQKASGTDGKCDDAADCDQSIGPAGQHCSEGVCKQSSATCTTNSNCGNNLVCITNVCTQRSENGGLCDEAADCSQTIPLGCQDNRCTPSGVHGGPCGANEYCGSDPACISPGNASGTMLCQAGRCNCPSYDFCYENRNCGFTADGKAQVCVPQVIPATSKICKVPQDPPGGCCDEKADCRPIGLSTCRLIPGPLGCNGGHCIMGKTQGVQCTTNDECAGVLVCKKNPLFPERTYTTCEYP